MTASPLRSDLRPPRDPAALDRWLRNREERLAAVLSREITSLVQRCVNRFSESLPSLTASGDYAVFDDIPAEWMDVVDGRLLPEAEQVYLGAGLNVWGSVAEAAISTAGAIGWASVVNESARDFLTRRRNFMVGVGDTLFQGVIAQVDRAVATGASTEEIKQSLERLGNFSEFRADTIARTEIQTAYAVGNWEASLALGEFGPTEKEWLTAGDERVRDTHRDLDGVVLPMDQPFTVGGVQMMHPKQEGAPASEVVNCRCVLLEYRPGDTRRDGSVVPEQVAPQPAPEPEPLPETPAIAEPAPEVAPKRTYRRLTADMPEVQAVARRWDVDPDVVLQTRDRARQVRREIRQEARLVQREAAKQLDLAQAHRMHSPGRNPSAEYDWFTGLDPKEKQRLRQRWMRSDATTLDPDEIADMMSNHLREFASMDEAMEEWLRLTRVHDAAGAVGSGKVPVARAYSGEVRVRELVGKYADSDIDVQALLVADDLEAAAIVARGERDFIIREARQLLDTAATAQVGPPPHRMSFISWFDELIEVEYDMRSLVDPPRALRQRYDELLPEAFIDADATAEEIYARLVETARMADLEVSPNAIIPWA